MIAFQDLRGPLFNRVVQSERLLAVPGVRHGISSRVAGMGKAHGNVAFSPPRDQPDAWVMRMEWCAELGLDPEAIVTAGQVHAATMLIAERTSSGLGARPGSGRLGLGDALLTRDVGPVLLTLHADCLPILLVDPDLPAVAAVHAGWRGTVANISSAVVSRMTESFGSDPGRLLAFLGPAICRECYEVGADVTEAWAAVAGNDANVAIGIEASGARFDLCAANRFLLHQAGLDLANIDASNICSRCGGDEWFSHRGQGPETGRYGAFIAIV